MSCSELDRFLFKREDYDVLMAIKVFLPSYHSLAGNRNMTRGDFTAPFTVRMAKPILGKGHFP